MGDLHSAIYVPKIGKSRGLYSRVPVYRDSSGGAIPKRVLVIDQSVPTYDMDSGSCRMYYILKLLARLNYSVVFYPGDRLRREPYTEKLESIGVKVLFDDLVSFLRTRGGDFSITILSRPDEAFKYLPYIRAYAINSKVIYDTVDIHWVRFERALKLHNSSELLERARYFRSIEYVNAESSDLTLAVTEIDKNFLLEVCRDVNIEVIPTIHEAYSHKAPFSDRKDLLFIGGFNHQPNVDAVLHFISKIFPIIRVKIPGIKIHVVGSNPPASILNLSSEDINVTGYIQDVQPYFLGSRVFVAPLRYGAGMKGKIGQSMSFGLPLVTTSIGSEGMGLVNGKNALIADQPERFADEVVRLYNDEELWDRISANSVLHIKNNFAPEIIGKKLDSLLISLMETKVPTTSLHFRTAAANNPQLPAKEENSSFTGNESGKKAAGAHRKGSVLVVGVYLADKKNNIDHIVGELGSANEWEVSQRWAAIGRTRASSKVRGVTVYTEEKMLPKYTMLNRLLNLERVSDYDYIIFCDDDIALPPGFLDRFLDIQKKYDFALAQPSRTHNSYIDFTIVEKIDGLTARKTNFVEQGPLFSFRRDAIELVMPFDEKLSPMGWGFEFVWPCLLGENGLRLGIIDATPVDHSMRKTVSYYNFSESRRQMEDYLSRNPHLSFEEAFTITESYAD